MFIGAVMMSMLDSMLTMQREKFLANKEIKKKMIDNEIKRLSDSSRIDRTTKRTVRLIKLVFTGRSIVQSRLKPVYFRGKRQRRTLNDKVLAFIEPKYIALVDLCGNIVENVNFQNFVTFFIIIASLEVGLQTDADLTLKLVKYTDPLDAIILSVFTAECALKIIAEGPTFWLYFHSNWNKFDFLIVTASYLPTGSGSLVMMLRLLRLLRVLKLLRAFPKLQVIVEALLKGMSSIFFIGVILLIWIYFYAILGNIFFKENDDWHFGTLHMAMLTLFQVVTLDNWSTVMNINLYGCYAPVWEYEPGSSDYRCKDGSKGSFITSALYFSTFTIIGAFLLLTLFIGVVGMSMEEATHEQKEEEEVFKKVHKVMEDFEIDSYTVMVIFF